MNVRFVHSLAPAGQLSPDHPQVVHKPTIVIP